MKGYSKKDNGDVVLTMTQEDYMRLLMALGFATGATNNPETRVVFVGLINRLNAGNPRFTPYKTGATN